MNFILREYLSLLKESGELEELIFDLLLTMGVIPKSKPKRGVRQYGVDIAATGIDTKDNIKKLFLFLIKKGDFTRSTWDGNVQAIRPSMNEIFDVYLKTHIESVDKDLPISIILVFNGDIEQNALINWAQYTNSIDAPNVQLDYWDGNKLALMIDTYLFDENILPKDFQSHLRRTLPFLEVSDFDLKDFYFLIEKILSDAISKSETEKLKSFRLISLCLNILFKWAEKADNLKPAFLAFERTILKVWEWLSKDNLLVNKELAREFVKIFILSSNILVAYSDKIKKHCYIKDGLSNHGGVAEKIEYPLITLEQIGLLSIVSLVRLMCYDLTKNRAFLIDSVIISNEIINLIHTNKSSFNILYDGHIIDITLTLYLMKILRKWKAIRNWPLGIVNYIDANYKLRGKFPVLSDSYDDLVFIEFGYAEDKAESSTLLPILAEWSVVFKDGEIYETIKKIKEITLKKTDMQIWLPESDIEDFIYKEYAFYYSGLMRTSIDFCPNFEEYKTQIITEFKREIDYSRISFIKEKFDIIGLIASRHYRMQPFPYYWRKFIDSGFPPSRE